MISDVAFKAWVKARYGDNPPARIVINLADHGPIPACYATTPDGMRVLQRHNAKTGVFA